VRALDPEKAVAKDGEWAGVRCCGTPPWWPAPGDKETNQLLGDCYMRQDKFSLSVPRWQAAGKETYAKWFAALGGEAYQVRGDIARLPWQQMDPEPLVEASVNGGPPKRFTFYTGARTWACPRK
jgi:hypothetical protein